MKKIISLTAALVLGTCLLAGCGEKAVDPDTTEASVQPTATTAAATVDRSEYPNLVQLPDYQNGSFTAIAEKAVYDEDNFDSQLAAYMEQYPNTKAVDRPAEMGDYIDFDYEGYIDGELFDGGSGSTALVIGSHSFIDSFEEALVGYEAGKSYDMNISFPEEYTAELAGKPVLFKVTVHSVSEVLPAELTDEYVAAHFEGYDNAEEFRADMITAYKQMAETETITNGQDAAFQVIRDAATISSVPEDLINKHLSQVLQEMENQLSSFGMDVSYYLQLTGMSEEDYLAEARTNAITAAGTEMVVWAIAAKEGITATEDEINDCVTTFKNYYGLTVDERDLLNAYGKETFEYSVINNKVFTVLPSYVQVTYTDPE